MPKNPYFIGGTESLKYLKLFKYNKTVHGCVFSLLIKNTPKISKSTEKRKTLFSEKGEKTKKNKIEKKRKKVAPKKE